MFKQNANKVLMVALQGVASGSNFLLVIILTRVYGLETFGVFSMIWLILIFTLGLQQSMILSPLLTLWAKNNDKNIWNGFFQLNLLLAILMALFAGLFARYVHLFASKWIIDKYSLVIFFMVIVFSMHLFNRRSLINMGYTVFVLLIDSLAYLPPLVAILVFKPALVTVLIIQVAFMGLAMLIGTLQLKPGFVPLKELKPLVVDIWKFSSWLLLTGVLQWFSGNFFIVATGTILGASALGIIRLGQSAIGVFNVFFISLENRVPFSASRLLSVDGKVKMQRYLTDIFVKGVFVTLLTMGVFALASKQLIGFLYGGIYAQYYWVLILFAGLQLFVFISTLFQITIRTVEKTRIIFLVYLVITVFSMSLAFPVVRQWGIQGALAGLYAAQLIGIIIYTITLKLQWKKI